jgi:hypothetical protein
MIVLCAENESYDHLFFECVVAKEVWRALGPLTGIVLNPKMLDISSKWLCVKKFEAQNIVHAVVIWSLWKIRNYLCFNRVPWSGMQMVYLKVSYTLARSEPLWSQERRESINGVSGALVSLAR